MVDLPIMSVAAKKMEDPKKANQPALRLRITSTAEKILRSGHPWIFAESVREQNREGQSGELAIIYDRKDRFLALGLFDPHSPIRIRVLHTGKPEKLDSQWWSRRSDYDRPPDWALTWCCRHPAAEMLRRPCLQ